MSPNDSMQSINTEISKFLDKFVDLSKQQIEAIISEKLAPFEVRLQDISNHLNAVNSNINELQNTLKSFERQSNHTQAPYAEPLRHASHDDEKMAQTPLKDSYLASIKGAIIDRHQFSFSSDSKRQLYLMALAQFDQMYEKTDPPTPFPQPYHGLAVHFLACIVNLPNKYPQDEVYDTHQNRYNSVLKKIDRNRQDHITQLDIATLQKEFCSLDAVIGLESEWGILDRYFGEYNQIREKQQIAAPKLPTQNKKTNN